MQYKLNVQPFCRQSFHSFRDWTLKEGPGQPEQSMVVFATYVLMSRLGFTVIASIHCCYFNLLLYINYVQLFASLCRAQRIFIWQSIALMWNQKNPPPQSPNNMFKLYTNQQFWHFWQTALTAPLGQQWGKKRENEVSQLNRRERRAKFQTKLDAELKKKDDAAVAERQELQATLVETQERSEEMKHSLKKAESDLSTAKMELSRRSGEVQCLASKNSYLTGELEAKKEERLTQSSSKCQLMVTCECCF